MSDKLHVESLPSGEAHNEPSSLVLQKEIKRRLMADAGVSDLIYPDAAVTEETEDALQETPVQRMPLSDLRSRKNPLELIAEAIKTIDSNELVEVYGPFGRITFRAMHISSNDYGLAFIVNKDHMTYEPKINTSLDIKCGGQSHKVVYAGGYFTFRQMPFTFLSFIKITEETTDD
jgi:hypothetical protein